jgi:hypothetical protein
MTMINGKPPPASRLQALHSARLRFPLVLMQELRLRWTFRVGCSGCLAPRPTSTIFPADHDREGLLQLLVRILYN